MASLGFFTGINNVGGALEWSSLGSAKSGNLLAVRSDYTLLHDYRSTRCLDLHPHNPIYLKHWYFYLFYFALTAERIKLMTR